MSSVEIVVIHDDLTLTTLMDVFVRNAYMRSLSTMGGAINVFTTVEMHRLHFLEILFSYHFKLPVLSGGGFRIPEKFYLPYIRPMFNIINMKQTKEVKRKETMEKAIYVKAPKDFVEMLSQSQWHLKMRPAQIVREAVIEYLERHLSKEAKEKIFKKGVKK